MEMFTFLKRKLVVKILLGKLPVNLGLLGISFFFLFYFCFSSSVLAQDSLERQIYNLVGLEYLFG